MRRKRRRRTNEDKEGRREEEEEEENENKRMRRKRRRRTNEDEEGKREEEEEEEERRGRRTDERDFIIKLKTTDIKTHNTEQTQICHQTSFTTLCITTAAYCQARIALIASEAL